VKASDSILSAGSHHTPAGQVGGLTGKLPIGPTGPDAAEEEHDAGAVFVRFLRRLVVKLQITLQRGFVNAFLRVHSGFGEVRLPVPSVWLGFGFCSARCLSDGNRGHALKQDGD